MFGKFDWARAGDAHDDQMPAITKPHVTATRAIVLNVPRSTMMSLWCESCSRGLITIFYTATKNAVRAARTVPICRLESYFKAIRALLRCQEFCGFERMFRLSQWPALQVKGGTRIRATGRLAAHFIRMKA
jgi:hypothetical protein